MLNEFFKEASIYMTQVKNGTNGASYSLKFEETLGMLVRFDLIATLYDYQVIILFQALKIRN